MPRVSTKKILAALQDAGVIESFKSKKFYDDLRDVHETVFVVTSEHIYIDHEIYGKNARMYFHGKGNTPEEKAQNADLARAAIRSLGYNDKNLNENWMGRDNRRFFEIPVTYFKGSRWWE